MNIAVSACLLGVDCRYSGDSTKRESIVKLSEKHNLIPICPEQLGGLPTPRYPSERRGKLVINNQGVDVTKEFTQGAEQALYIAKLFECKVAILKKNSPSCGYGQIYDGTFTGNKVKGNGVTAELFVENGIPVYNEDNFEDGIDF